MRWRPGNNLVRAGLLLAMMSVGGFAFSWIAYAVAALGVLILLLALADFLQLRRVSPLLAAKRSLPASVGRGDSFQVKLSFSYAGKSSLSARVRDVVPVQALPPVHMERIKLMPGGTINVHYLLTLPQRGLHRFGDVYIRLSGRFHMMEVQISFPYKDQIKVLPESAAPDQALRKDALDEQRLLEAAMETRKRGEGTELESLSEYRPGDEPRRMDWRSSARQRKLIVRRYQVEQHREVVILLDSGRLMGLDAGAGTKLDRCIDSMLLLARIALKKGDRCGVGVFDNKVRGYLPPMSGIQSLRMLTEAVFQIESHFNESNFAEMFATLQARQQKRAFVIILSDMVDAETTEKYRAALASLSRRHTVLFAAVRTPLLWQSIRAPVTEPRHASQKAVVFRLLQDRERTLHAVRRSGVSVLDVEPQQITIPLINEYLALRERAVI